MESKRLKKIQKDLDFLKKEVAEIKEHMVDVDSILTEDDYKALLEYRREKAKGKLISHDELKREPGKSGFSIVSDKESAILGT